MHARCLAVAAFIAASHAAAQPQEIMVRFTNNQPAGGWSTAPLWFGVHNGLFDHFNAGSPATVSTEALAELGVGAGLSEQVGNDGFSGVVATDPVHPQFTPGETATSSLMILNPGINRWFSFAAMIVPSNDFFFGNDNPVAHPIFDASGVFSGPLTIQIFGNNVWDAQTETEDVNVGPAFLVGRDAAGGFPENGTIQPLFGQPANMTYLQSIVGMQTPVYTVSDVLTGAELLGTIEITLVPAPASLVLFAMGAALAGRRRRGARRG
jgi:hypothetical protein